MAAPPDEIRGRLVLDDRIVPGSVSVSDGLISEVSLGSEAGEAISGHYICPGFADVHVHGWGGHSAMAGPAALEGMARALVRRGVTSFLPTAVSAPLSQLETFASDVRNWLAKAPADGAQPLGFNLEGPFLAHGRRGAHDPAQLLSPATVPRSKLEPLLDGLRLITIAPELPGARELIGWLAERGVAVSLGHSEAAYDMALAGYRAGARSTTHLFNAMSGLDHRAPGLALTALLQDEAYVELIADGVHVDSNLWPLVSRLKPVDRLLLVSDAVELAGTGDGRGRLGGLEVEVRGERVTLAGSQTLAGSVIALDTAVRNMVASGAPLPAAVAAASRNPLTLLGITDRGRLAAGQRADLLLLDDRLEVRRVMLAGRWLDA